VLGFRPARQGFIEPCLPSRTAHPPLGPAWLHEIKYDGFRLLARRAGRSVRLLTRRGYDWTNRFRRIANAVASLRCRSCLIDGEAVTCDEQGTLFSSCSFAIASTPQPNSTRLTRSRSTDKTFGANRSSCASMCSLSC
jgi:bifunctional non-homologous end joining protein LigD